jgi:hypothetical protein
LDYKKSLFGERLVIGNTNKSKVMEKRSTGKELAVVPDTVPVLNSNKASFKAIEDFTQLINNPPPREGVQKTPDGKAETLVISYVEAKLDEIYLRQWGTEDVHVQQIGNEVLVWLTLWVIDPQTKMKITRSGFSAVVITVDKAPEGVQGKEKNAWALDMSNKKPNAMYLSFPKAKSMAIKNAAQTLGTIYGRNLNRKFEDIPETFYGNEFDAREAIDKIAERISECKNVHELSVIWNEFPEMHTNSTFIKNFSYYKNKIAKI